MPDCTPSPRSSARPTRPPRERRRRGSTARTTSCCVEWRCRRSWRRRKVAGVQGGQDVGGREEGAGVRIFTGGRDDAAPVSSVDASSGTPLFTDGPFVESREHLGGFAVVDVVDEQAARLWAAQIALA